MLPIPVTQGTGSFMVLFLKVAMFSITDQGTGDCWGRQQRKILTSLV